MQRNPADAGVPAGGRAGRSGSRRWRAAKSPRVDDRDRAAPAARSRLHATPTGKPRTLADWRGRTVLLNLWATWCVPCRKEMPALDALQAKLGGDELRGGRGQYRHPRPRQAARPGCKEVGIKRLAYYADPSAKVFQDLKAIGKAFGMPTTLLIDPHGCELGALAGPAEWASDDAIKLIDGRDRNERRRSFPDRPPGRFGARRLVADDARRSAP